MLRALYSAASGMQSQQMNLDVISNNLANANTTGFKASKLQFQDLLYQNTKEAGSQQGGGNTLPASLQVGQGSVPVATERSFAQGDLTQTGNNLDIAIQGQGFFEVQMPDGTLAYTRDGSFKTDSQGRVVTSDGYPSRRFSAVPTGTPASPSPPAARPLTPRPRQHEFSNPAGAVPQSRRPGCHGPNLYKETTASGTAELGQPPKTARGNCNREALEGSNVSVVQEMVNMILAQRAYEVNSKAVQAADQMMQDSNNLQR